MDFTISVFLFAVLLLAFAIFRGATRKRKSEPERIRDWATENAVDIIFAERRRFLKGPFSFAINPGGNVFHIIVRLNAEERKEGWLCLHSSVFFGKDWEEVKWTKQYRAKV